VGRDDARPDVGRAHPQGAGLTGGSRFAVFPLFFQRKCGPLPRAASRSERHAAEVGRDDARPDFGRAHPQGAGQTAESRFAVFPLFFQRKCCPLPRAASRSEPRAAVEAGRLRALYFPVNIYVDRLRRCHDRRDQHALPIRFLAAPCPRVLVEPFRFGLKLPFRCFPLFLLQLRASDDLRRHRRGRRLGQQRAVLDEQRLGDERGLVARVTGPACGIVGPAGRERPAALYFRCVCRHALLPPSSDIPARWEHSMNRSTMQVLARCVSG